MIPIVAAIVWLGVYPAPVLNRMQGAAAHFVSMVERGQNAHLPDATAGGMQ